MILENSIFQYVDKENQNRIRVIYVDSESKYLYYVDLDSKLGMPKKELVEKIQTEISGNILIKTPDPFFKSIVEEQLTDVEKEKRDLYWSIIQKYWYENKENIFKKNGRKEILEKIANENSLSIATVKRIFIRFWQRGMTKNALLPDYKKSGGKGKSKKLSDNKVGRPKKINYVGKAIEGINVTEDIKKIFEVSISRYYRKREKPSLKSAYDSMLREFFSDTYTENREMKNKVWDKSKIPTYRQFYYWFKKLEDIEKDIAFRESNKAYDLKHRPILSNSTIEIDGPGTRFQIDATVADVYLVSSLNRNRIIGRPIVYAVIDVYSRIIAGIYVGLEGPSWMGAMMALDNMIANKVEFCMKYGIEIKKEQWLTYQR